MGYRPSRLSRQRCDYRLAPTYKQGLLGANFAYDNKSGGYKVTHIVKGDPWHEKENSALSRIGVNIKEGDIILGVNNEKLSKDIAPEQLLVNKANQEVLLPTNLPNFKIL